VSAQLDLLVPTGPSLTTRQAFGACLDQHVGRRSIRDQVGAYLLPYQVTALEELVAAGRFAEWRRGRDGALAGAVRAVLQGGRVVA
jgi:hypothetical protein